MGASTRLLRRILVIIGITLFLCFVVTTQRSLVSLNREEAGGGKRTNNGGRNGQQRYRGFNKMVPVRPNSINRGRGEGEEEKSLGNFFLKNGALTNEGKLELILSAKVHLVDIRIPNGALSIHGGNNDNEGDYNGVTGEFCHVDWEKHKNDPSTGKYDLSWRLLSPSGTV